MFITDGSGLAVKGGHAARLRVGVLDPHHLVPGRCERSRAATAAAPMMLKPIRLISAGP
jgi:hypothetical protein